MMFQKCVEGDYGWMPEEIKTATLELREERITRRWKEFKMSWLRKERTQ